MTDTNTVVHPLGVAMTEPLAAAMAGLDSIRSATMTLSRVMARVAEPGSDAVEPLSRMRAWVLSERASMVAVLQSSDAIEQRSSHIRAVLNRLPQDDESGRAWAVCVVAAQLQGIADLLIETAQTAEKALSAAKVQLIEAGEAYAPAGALDLAGSGLAAAGDLHGTADQLIRIADATPQPAQPLADTDLAWISELYTMNSERDIHARLTRLGFTPRTALSA